MQNPRRPPGDNRRASGTRARPVTWSRRLEEAREERARVLAAREAQDAGGPSAPEPAPHDLPGGRDPPPASEAAGEEQPRTGATWIHWWIGGGFLAGAAVGAAVIWALLPAEQTVPPASESAGATAPAVPAPSPEGAGDAPSAADTSAIEDVAADGVPDGAMEAPEAAPLPPSPAVNRAGEAESEVEVADAQLAEAAGTGPSSAAGSGDAEDLGAVFDLVPLPEVEPAPPPMETPPRPPADDRPDEEPGSTLEAAEPNATSGRGVGASQETARLVPPAANGATTGSASTERRALSASDGEPGEEAESRLAASAPAEDPPPPLEVPGSSAGDAPNDDAPPDMPGRGGGILHVHAAPQVSSEELAGIVERLEDAGYAVEESRVDFRISQTNVRYFHAEDAELAAGVAEAVAGISRDFTGYEPAPDVGTIEVWLEG